MIFYSYKISLQTITILITKLNGLDVDWMNTYLVILISCLVIILPSYEKSVKEYSKAHTYIIIF